MNKLALMLGKKKAKTLQSTIFTKYICIASK